MKIQPWKRTTARRRSSSDRFETPSCIRMPSSTFRRRATTAIVEVFPDPDDRPGGIHLSLGRPAAEDTIHLDAVLEYQRPGLPECGVAASSDGGGPQSHRAERARRARGGPPSVDVVASQLVSANGSQSSHSKSVGQLLALLHLFGTRSGYRGPADGAALATQAGVDSRRRGAGA